MRSGREVANDSERVVVSDMNVLFCSDAMIVDGVTSFVFHLSTALREGGHRVAVLGRWAGKGFQSRLRERGVEVISIPSPTVGNFWFDRKAREFAPDVIVTDSRRSFPLAVRLKGVTGARIFTFFLDHLEKTDRKGRDVESLVRHSDAWLSAEPPILKKLEEIPTPFPKFLFQRPLTGLLSPTPTLPRDPFRILCFGRISGYKSAGPLALLRGAAELKRQIPSLEITLVGGGWRAWRFRLLAERANLEAGERYIRLVGTQTDPQSWFEWATLVCAGSTSAVEAALANRPVLAFSGFWIGRLTPASMELALSTYFGERGGPFYVKDRPELIPAEVLSLYRDWDGRMIREDSELVRSVLEPLFHREGAAEEFGRIYDSLAERG